MSFALDPSAEGFRALSFTSTELSFGSVLAPIPAASCSAGILLRHIDPQRYTTRYLLARDEKGAYATQDHHADVFPIARPQDVRVVLGDILMDKLPGKPAEAIGLLGIDGFGAFVTVDARSNDGEKRAATVCLREWSRVLGADRAHQARLFYATWQIVVVDQFGNRIVIV